MIYGVVANPEREECLKLAREVHEKLGAIVEKNTGEALGIGGTPLEEMNVDILITLGGDGTILLALQRARGKILGVNMGVLGYLTEIEPDELWKAIRNIETGHYWVEKRMRLKVKLNGIRLYDCTNEVVVHTSEIAKLRTYRIYYKNELLYEFRADGIIVATPTGSTSYSLSAGGPILYPHVDGVVITPIAPFKGKPVPFVFPAGKIKVELADGRENILVLDGQYSVEVSGQDKIEIDKSENYAEFIRFREESFMKRLRERILG